MRLKYLLFIFILYIGLLPAMANDLAFDENYVRQISNEIKPQLSLNIKHKKLKLSDPEEIKIIASDFVDRLYKALLPTAKGLDEKEMEHLTKTLKLDITHIATFENNNVELLETFVKAYHERTLTYGAMQTPLDLFLERVLQGDSFINTLKVLQGDRETIKLITEMYTNNLDWKFYIEMNQRDILKAVIKNERLFLSDFSKMIESTISKSLTQADRQILAKISILSDMINVADNEYQLTKQEARYGGIGARAELRADALQKCFGELKTEDAKFLSEIFEKTTPSSLEKMLPETKEWLNGFLKWNERNLKPKGNIILSITAMVAIIAVGELISEYTNQPSNYYLSAVDEINDSLEKENYIDLVYKSIYDTKYAKVLDTVFEENMDEKEQLAYIDTLIMFNKAIFDVFLKETEDKIDKQIYNCFTYGTDCDRA